MAQLVDAILHLYGWFATHLHELCPVFFHWPDLMYCTTHAKYVMWQAGTCWTGHTQLALLSNALHVCCNSWQHIKMVMVSHETYSSKSYKQACWEASCASHPKLLHMSHGEPSNHVSSWGPPELSHPEHYPKISLTVPAPGCGKPIPQPSNDHSPRPATLGIHPSIEPCRHPITSKPLPSTQVWHGLQKSMLVKDMECS